MQPSDAHQADPAALLCVFRLLQKRIELVDAYARVIAMIEIEVEMDTDLPAAEVLGACDGLVAWGSGWPEGVQGCRLHEPMQVPEARVHSTQACLPLCCCPSTHTPTHPPCACTAGIEQQIARLSEIESLQEEWQIQVRGPAGSCAGRQLRCSVHLSA